MSLGRSIFAAAVVVLAFVACTDAPVAPDIDPQPQLAANAQGG